MTIYYVMLDGNGLPTAYYPDDVFPPKADGSPNAAIPAGAQSIDPASYQDCIANPGLRKIVGGASSAYTPPTPPPIVPPTISRRQLATELANDGDISQGEAISWLATGTLPAIFTSTISKLPQAQQFPASMAMLADTFDRSSTWTSMIGAMLGKSDAQIDAIWTAAYALA